MAPLGTVVTSLLLLSVSILNIECNNTVNPDDPNLFSDVYQSGVDMLQKDIAKDTVKIFLEDVKDIMDNQIAHDILTGISATFKIVFTDIIGHDTVIAIAQGITNILKDQGTTQSIDAFVKGGKTILGNSNALGLFKLEFQAFNEIIQLPNTPKVIDVIGAGFTKILSNSKINTAIKNSFENMIKLSKSYNPTTRT